VRVVDAGVDDGNLDVLAVQAEVLQTEGALISGTPLVFDGLMSCSRRTPTTPFNDASAGALSRAIRTLMPLYDDW
jgi:hypothetical protein